MPRSLSRRWVGAALALLGAGGCALPEVKSPAPPGAEASVRAGGALTVGVTAPAGVDPLSFHEPSALLLGSVLCDTLVTVDPETGHLSPGLAQKWTVADDGTRVIFQLRRDASFHDGRPVRSADVADSLRRLANPEHASYVAGLMDGVFGLERFRADAEEGLPEPSLTGVRVIEPFSFEIFLRPGNPDFLRALAHPATAPVSKSPYDEHPETAAAHPQCAGPYRLAAPYKTGDAEIVLTRFDRYWARNAAFTAGGKGYVDELRFRVYPDENAAFQAWERGEVDVAGVPTPRVAEARTRFGARAVTGDIPYEEFIGLPSGEHSPLAHRGARLALSLALDRAALVKEVYGDAHLPADGFVPPALTTAPYPRRGKGGVEVVRYGCGHRAGAAQPEEARRLWQEASKASSVSVLDGGVLKLYFNDESTHRTLAAAVVRQWQEVLGITVELVPLNWDSYLQRGTVGTGFDGAFRVSHAPLYPSPQAFLGSLFRSRSAGGPNLGRYTNSAFDSAFDEDLRPVVDGTERQLRLQDVEELLCVDMPIIPIAFGRRTVLFSERLVAARTSGRLLSRDGIPLLRELAVGA